MKKFLFGILGLLFAVPAVAATLPAGYTELEYIESTGTLSQSNYCLLPYTLGEKIEVELSANDNRTTGTIVSFSAETSATMGNQGTWFGGGADDVASIGGGFEWSAIKTRTKVTISYDGESIDVTISGDTKSRGTPKTTPTTVFAVGSTSVQYLAKGVKIYSVIKQNGTLVAFPAKRNSDNVIGMYDTVSGTFFTNAGTGTFVAGDPVNTCPNGGTYTSATGTVTVSGTPTLNAPVYPTFYTQGNMTLRKVGDIADSYDATTGIITRRVGEYVFTGNENIVLNYSVYGMTGIPYDHDAYNNGSSVYLGFCSHAKTYTNSGSVSGSTRTFDKFLFFTNVDFVGFGSYETPSGITEAADVKQWLADQYNAGTPVTIWYPLKEANYTTEYVGTEWCEGIKIATTAYNSARFSPVVTELNDTIATIRSVVTNTINQTKAIADLQATKQTRPDEQCPAGKKCLLVEDDAGQPHWYEIIENAD